MKDKRTLEVKILHYRGFIVPTKEIYRSALKDLIQVIDENYDEMLSLGLKSKERNNYVEKLIHKTKDNPFPKYEWFDEKYPKMPSYFRRNVITEALGKVSSYRENLALWEKNGKVGKCPKLILNHNSFPTFYKGNTFVNSLEENKCEIKLFNPKKCKNNQGVWEYYTLDLRATDCKRIMKLCGGDKSKISNPTLTRRGKCWYLRFLITNDISLIDVEKENENGNLEKICSVDLGFNTLATCTIMDKNGTIHNRKFIKNTLLIDHLDHTLNRIKKAQRLGAKRPKYLWAKANNYNETLATYCSKEIVAFAKENGCSTIVLEYLDTKGKKNKLGKMKQKISLWRHRDINKKVERFAHRESMHYSRVCAINTSKLAFDGSGFVLRGHKVSNTTPYDICKFQNDKIYNCDLNASYNIGARYFIRKLFKSTNASLWSLVVAKVPPLRARMLCTLDTLIKANECLASLSS